MAALSVVTLCCVLGAISGEENTASLKIDVSREGPQVPPSLYGIFFEEINHAGDGGLYAELLQNRDFESSRVPEGCQIQGTEAVSPVGFKRHFDATHSCPGWKIISEKGTKVCLALDAETPLNSQNPHAGRVEIQETDGSLAGIANEGYWGIPVVTGGGYDLRLHARCSPEFKGSLLVLLQGKDGKTLDRAEIKGLSETWQEFRCRLKSKRTDSESRLAILSSSTGTFWLDGLSFFPVETWKSRPNGLRPDLAEMLAALSPGFVRFPGGCFVEGVTPENAFLWKNTIGDIVQRPGHWCLWDYHSTDGLGYHEYLQMCEDLGAAGMFVVNCGMSCQGAGAMVVPEDQLGPWIQDALDAVEYALGPATSTWGGLRAKHGHPEPFDLRYIEIGNENSGPIYDKHYALFYKALKAKYPQVQLIANVPVTGQPMDIVDEHYYSNPEFFMGQANRYDSYDRKGPKIYVGEYACTQGVGTGNLRGALAEAAFMMGMERNADVVVMASYAPLFVNVRDRRWNPDLIGFDNRQCYGTPSYYVQKLFGTNRPDVILATELDAALEEISLAGGIGLGTWETQAEYKDLRVTHGDTVLLEQDVPDAVTGWNAVRGEWRAQEGAYRQSGPDVDTLALAQISPWQDYTLRLKARKISGREGFLILFHVQDQDNFFWLNLGGWGNSMHGVEWERGGSRGVIGPRMTGSIDTGRWYDIQVELKGGHIRCLLDGQVVQDLEVPRPASLYAVAGRDQAGKEIILKVVNGTDKDCRTSVQIQGVESVDPIGKVVLLTSDSAQDENSLNEPYKVRPVLLEKEGLGTTFDYDFPAHSLTVLRLPYRRK